MYILLHQLDKLIRQIAVLVHQAPDPAVAAEWCVRELASRMGLKVVLANHWLSSSARLEAAGSEVLEALRTGMTQEHDIEATREAARAVQRQLEEELEAFDTGQEGDGYESDLEQDWGELAAR